MNAHNQLIPIEIVNTVIQNENQPTCNARDLHAFLEVGKDFSTWIKDRIEQLGFDENQDFIILTETGEYSGRGQPKKEYHLTLDMAKHLSMIERTPKGHEARQYFIECERIVLQELRDSASFSLDALPISMYLPEENDILCIGDDGRISIGLNNRFRDHPSIFSGCPRLVIGLPTPQFNAMSCHQSALPRPDVFGFPLWIDMRGREAFVKNPPGYPSFSPYHMPLPHSKTLIIGRFSEISRLIDERGYAVTEFLTRKQGPRS
ncbi:MAG: antA/AntB antirepressor family protein [Acidithiobacillus sp.]